jgi:hypothetical protein
MKRSHQYDLAEVRDLAARVRRRCCVHTYWLRIVMNLLPLSSSTHFVTFSLPVLRDGRQLRSAERLWNETRYPPKAGASFQGLDRVEFELLHPPARGSASSFWASFVPLESSASMPDKRQAMTA